MYGWIQCVCRGFIISVGLIGNWVLNDDTDRMMLDSRFIDGNDRT